MASESEELFDSKFLDRLRSLFLKLRKRRQMNKPGAQATPASGFTREFKDHRHYVPGDDFRNIDWKLAARLDREYIRVFEEIQEFHVHILLDCSGSMMEPFASKRIAALRLAVALSYLALVSQHRVSILTLSDEIRRETQPLKGQGHIHLVLKKLAGLEFRGPTNLVECLKQFRPSRDRKGIVFVISDLFGRSPEMSNEALYQCSQWPAETHVIQMLHPEEMRPQLEGEIRLVDVETEEVRRIWMTKREQVRYAEAFDSFLEDIRRFCMQRQIGYFPWTTDQPFDETFINLLSRGNALAAAT